MRHKKRLRTYLRADDGSASLEFLTAGMILIMPLVYIVLAMGELQGAQLAVEGAARSAARLYVQADNVEAANSIAERSIQFALHDYGVDDEPRHVIIACSPLADRCLDRDSTVAVSVRVDVRLPLVPAILSLDRVATIPVVGTARNSVSQFTVAQQ